MSKWLVDPTGTVWPADSDRLRAKIGFADRAPADWASFLVANMGFIAVEQLGNGLGVRWRPTYTQRATVAATIILLHDQPEQRVVMSAVDGANAHGLFPAITPACDHMLDRFATDRCTKGGHFLARPRAHQSLQPGTALRGAMDDAVAKALAFDPQSLWESLQRSVGGRFLLLDHEPVADKFRVLSLGTGYTKINRGWSSVTKGSDFEDQPDTAYAKATTQAFKVALATSVPVIEDVEATFWIPSRGRFAVGYTRLVLPIQINGRRHILSTSELHSFAPASRTFS